MEHFVSEKLHFLRSQKIASIESVLSLLFLDLLVVKDSIDSLFPGERRLISLSYSGMLSISLYYAFIAFCPTGRFLLQVTGHRSQVTGHRSQVTGYRSQKDISVGTRKVAIWSSEVV